MLTWYPGFSHDIGAKPNDVNDAVSLFFVTFVTLQPFSAAAGRWMGAKHWIAIMMVRPDPPLRSQWCVLTVVFS
jgi:hypothetical protein